MDKRFIDNLHEVVINHLADENFGASNLASLLGLSKSQTLRKVKAATGKSVNQYIREVKLAEAAKLIMETDFTSAEIAYKVGFSSPSYFNKTFRKHYGITPGGYKAQVSTQKENGLIKASIVDNSANPNHRKPTKQSLITIATLIIVVIAVAVYYFNQNPKNKIASEVSETTANDKSIAVLPFKNLSSNKENQYFADGIMEVILNHLTSIKELKVISRTSMEQYRETTKTIPEIARELGVSYILEGSVQKNENEIKIIAQLIDAKNDKHIWATDIKKEYKDIFELQSTIAKQISRELNTELSDVERKNIEKKPTNSLEAYNLYLKGLYFIRSGSSEKSFKFLEQAIELDPEFALAYANLAGAYMFSTYNGVHSPKKGVEKVRKLTQKAIALNNSLGQPHAIIATMMYRYEWNWKGAEKEFLIALNLEPNNAVNYMTFANFLQHTGRFEEAREKINQAMLLNPVSHFAYSNSSRKYYFSGDYEKALAENKKGIEIRNNITGTNWLNFEIYIAQKKYDIAVSELQKLKTPDESKEIDSIYSQFGIKGVYRWMIASNSVSKKYSTPYYLAQEYAFIGENEKALSLLEKSAELRISEMSRINIDPYFINLRSEPRFIAIVKKMGFDDYFNQQ